MEKSNQKKALVLSIVGVITLIAVVVGATFAYFTAQGGGTGNINVNANTATTDNLSFQVGEPISLSANQEDFGYAISPEDWDKAMSTEYSRVNWLFGGYDWFISPNTGDFGGAYSVDGGTDGTVSPQYVNSGNELPSNDIRPTFYLNSDVQYVSGDGSQQNPYRIA